MFELPFSWVVNAPTGSGKTTLALKKLKSCHKSLFVTPLRAQANELYQKNKSEFENLKLVTGGKKLGPVFARADLIIITCESLMRIISNWRRNLSWLAKVEIAIFDEIHLLESFSRGFNYELTISWLLRLNPFLRIWAMSATTGKDLDLLKWLQAAWLYDDHRPVPLEIEIERYHSGEKYSRLLALCRDQPMRTLVFVHSRNRVDKLAADFAAEGISTCVHHAGLSDKKREQVEKQVRKGETEVVFATPTLEMGLNLPVQRVILYDLYFKKKNSWELLSPRSFWQRLGRAGRPGLDSAGAGIVFISNYDRRAGTLLDKKFPPLQSQLQHEKFETFLFYELGFNFAKTAPEVSRNFRTTLAWHQGSRPDFARIVQAACNRGFLKEKKQRLQLSTIARAAVNSFLNPVYFSAVITKFQYNITEDDFLLLGLLSPEIEPVPLYFRELDFVADSILPRLNSYLLQNKRFELLQDFKVTSRSFMSIIKTLWLLNFYREGDLEDSPIITDFPRLKYMREYLFRFISTVERWFRKDIFQFGPPDFDTKARKTGLKFLCARARGFLYGLTPEARELLLLKGIGPVRAQKLLTAGLGSLDNLSEATPRELLQLKFSQKLSRRWPGDASVLKEKRKKVPRYEQKAVFDAGSNYEEGRLRRAFELSVKKEGEAGYFISGGKQAHRVCKRECDCLDFKGGNYCKHLIAVDLFGGKEKIDLKRKEKKINLLTWWSGRI
ncbi:MAG: helicase-related protein [Deltaproteobacteria bacterium]|nr:helicase-related protein [Deltaproteobacteria bacterium]